MSSVGTITLTLKDLLGLIGDLDDNPGANTPRERFRAMVRQNGPSAGQLRDWIGECVRNSGPQFNRALQDLVNAVGNLLGFTVEYGRYQGVHGENGFDGLWVSPTGFKIVVEVKTTETYAIKTNTLVGYVDQLISSRRVEDWNSALGLYVVGRPDPEIRQLEHSITIEHRTHQLRVITADALLNLAELMTECDVAHEDILSILQPSGPKIDPIVAILEKLVTQRIPKATATLDRTIPEPVQVIGPRPHGKTSGGREDRNGNQTSPTTNRPEYWITSVAPNEEQTAEEVVRSLIGREHVFACHSESPLMRISPGDWICFYATRIGIVAHANIVSAPTNQLHPAIRDNKRYCWVFELAGESVYVTHPVALDLQLRSKLAEFRGKDPGGNWAWFVQQPHKITKSDFQALTRGADIQYD